MTGGVGFQRTVKRFSTSDENLMNIDQGLDPAAKELAKRYQHLLDALPRTFSISIITKLKSWPNLFEPEKTYFTTLLEQLNALTPSERQSIFANLAAFESESGCDQIRDDDPFTLDQMLIRHIKRRGLWMPWRVQISQVFSKIQPSLDAALYSSDHSRRLVVILYDQGITIERNQLWQRFREVGVRVPLALENAITTKPFLRELFTGRPADAGPGIAPTLFSAIGKTPRPTPHDIWMIEADDALASLCGENVANAESSACVTGMSYVRLRDFREKISDVIYNRTSTGQITGPSELADYLRTLDIMPASSSILDSDPRVRAFIRDIFLGGAGTLVINNTFVEWSAIQAMKRAQPHVMVARFGVRYKMKPFSSLLLFSKPRPADKIPWMLDPWGSFIDVELLSYYIWLKSQEIIPYRDRTLYVLLADGVEEMLVVGPAKPAAVQNASWGKVTLPDVAVTMAEWMGVSLPGSSGKVIEPLLS